jgi:asparagine synthase (glutamine-hydrolysing)
MRLQAEAKDLLGTGNDVLFRRIDRAAPDHLTRLDPTTLQPVERARIERILDLSVWIEVYSPEIVF